MVTSSVTAGYLRCGMPYNRLGAGPRPLVIVQGLTFENKPQAGMMLGMYHFLAHDYTVYSVVRQPNLPQGYTLADMAADYACMIRQEFGEPVDVIGLSTGGSIVQHLAAEHPDVVRRLVIPSCAPTLGAAGKEVQLRLARLARERRWGDAYAALLGFMTQRHPLGKPFVWLMSQAMGLVDAPKDPSDLIVTIEAEDQHAFRDRLVEIVAPTLVIAGDEDPFYTPALFQETASGIPGARLILYEGMGHPASGKQFERDVLAFLQEDVGARAAQSS